MKLHVHVHDKWIYEIHVDLNINNNFFPLANSAKVILI